MLEVLFYGLSLAVGAGISLQAGVNAALARIVGITESTLVSVSVTWVCIVLLLAVGFRSGNMGQVGAAPPYLLIGGFFGAAILLTASRVVPAIGVAGYVAALIAGQLLASVALDHVGAFGHPRYPLDAARAAGVALLLLGMKLVLR